MTIFKAIEILKNYYGNYTQACKALGYSYNHITGVRLRGQHMSQRSQNLWISKAKAIQKQVALDTQIVALQVQLARLQKMKEEINA